MNNIFTNLVLHESGLTPVTKDLNLYSKVWKAFVTDVEKFDEFIREARAAAKENRKMKVLQFEKEQTPPKKIETNLLGEYLFDGGLLIDLKFKSNQWYRPFSRFLYYFKIKLVHPKEDIQGVSRKLKNYSQYGEEDELGIFEFDEEEEKSASQGLTQIEEESRSHTEDKEKKEEDNSEQEEKLARKSKKDAFEDERKLKERRIHLMKKHSSHKKKLKQKEFSEVDGEISKKIMKLPMNI